jgi:hypothetical protein
MKNFAIKIRYFSPPIFLDILIALKNLFRYFPFALELRKNKPYKNRYLGQSVVIIGNGPSLRLLDKKKLLGKKIIVMNGFHRGGFNEAFEIVAHCIGEPHTSSSWILEDVQESIEKTKSESYWLHISSCKFLEYLNIDKQIRYVHPVFPPSLSKGLGNDLALPVLSYQTTAQMAIQVAIYMGFTEIKLVGYDHDWLASPGFSKHFYSNEKDKTDHLDKHSYLELMRIVQNMWNVYYSINKIAKKLNIKITNASAHSYLDIFDREEL